MQKEVCDSNTQKCSRAWQRSSARASVPPIRIKIEDRATTGTHDICNPKLQSVWRNPIIFVNSKSSFVCTGEETISHLCFTVHTLIIFSYPATGLNEQTLQVFGKYLVQYDSTYHLIDAINNVQKRCGGCEVVVGCNGLDEGKAKTWDPLEQILEVLCGTLEVCICVEGDRNLKQEILDLYSELRITSENGILGHRKKSTATSCIINITDRCILS